MTVRRGKRYACEVNKNVKAFFQKFRFKENIGFYFNKKTDFSANNSCTLDNTFLLNKL